MKRPRMPNPQASPAPQLDWGMGNHAEIRRVEALSAEMVRVTHTPQRTRRSLDHWKQESSKQPRCFQESVQRARFSLQDAFQERTNKGWWRSASQCPIQSPITATWQMPSDMPASRSRRAYSPGALAWLDLGWAKRTALIGQLLLTLSKMKNLKNKWKPWFC